MAADVHENGRVDGRGADLHVVDEDLGILTVDDDLHARDTLAQSSQGLFDFLAALGRDIQVARGEVALVGLGGAQVVVKLQLHLSDVVEQTVVRCDLVGALELSERRTKGLFLEQLDTATEVGARLHPLLFAGALSKCHGVKQQAQRDDVSRRFHGRLSL
jgi:hypothetical protein